MTLSERYEEQIKMSAQQAMIEGKLEGIEDNTRRVTIKMLKMGMNEQQICQCTDIRMDK